MKKLRSVSLIAIMSVALVGNAFAGSSVGTGFLPFFDVAVNAAVSLFSSSLSGNDNCPVRVCGSCRPEERDDNGDCRPPAN